MIKRRYLIVAVGVVAVLLGSVLVTAVILAQAAGEYDPWLDYTEDGIIDVYDLLPFGQAYGTSGDPTRMNNVTVTNFPLDDQGNLRVNVTEGPLASDSMIAVKSKVVALVAPADASVGIDIRPPPGEVWVMHHLYVRSTNQIGESWARIVLVDNTTGVSVTIKEELSYYGEDAEVRLEAEAEHAPICSNDVYYRLECYNGLASAADVFFAYVGKRMK